MIDDANYSYNSMIDHYKLFKPIIISITVTHTYTHIYIYIYNYINKII